MRFANMTWPEVKKLNRQRVVVICPIAACEQHSLHLPTFTDTILVSAVAQGLEERLTDTVLLLPTLWLGASGHHLRFGATLSAGVTTHVQILTELLMPLLEDGFLRFLILNGHGGNIDTMHVALRVLQPQYPDRILSAASYWELAAGEFAKLVDGPRKEMGHACEFETSMMLHLNPELVRREEARNDPPRGDAALRGLFLADDMSQITTKGCVGFPELATAAKGERLLRAAIDRAVEVVSSLCTRPVPS